MELEKRGIPSVELVTSSFVKEAELVAKGRGMPGLRLVVLPANVEVMAEAELEAAASEAIQQAINAITGKAQQKRIVAKKGSGAGGILDIPDSPDRFYALVCEKRWGDGLPVVPPTPARVGRMFKYVDRAPDEVVADVAPAFGEATIRKIAVNAVMAGCLPQHMPVVVAAVEAMAAPEFNLNGIQATTNPVAPLLIVNGPARRDLDVNCSWGCLGLGWRANATIGRAIRLVLINLGGALPGDIDMAFLGMPAKYSFCLGEDEEGSAWEPLHVERGFSKEDSAVTVAGVQDMRNAAVSGTDVLSWLRVAADSLATVGNNDFWLGTGEPLFVITPAQSKALARAGLSKADVKRFLFEHSRLSLEKCLALTGGKREPGWRIVNGKLAPCEKPEDIMIVVAGAPETLHMMVMPTWGDTRAQTVAVRGKSKPHV
ncbi:MAG: hypothetical protein HYX87_05630 [Chloroflexi bacterium]|nr:hypothetical protein [Chloroflexota bacterium]